MAGPLVLYASQTGNAQDVAERIAREAAYQLYEPRVMPMDSYDITKLVSEQLVIFVTSTTGQGDVPDNARRFWRLLMRKGLQPGCLAGVRYALFGLGDSGYPEFNVVAKKLDRRLQGLGASPLLERGLGDDQHASGYEAALDPWLLALWPALRAALQLAGGTQQPSITPETIIDIGQPRYSITHLQQGAQQAGQQQQQQQDQQQAADELEQAALVAAAFKRLQAAAVDPGSWQGGGSSGSSGAMPAHGPHRPFMAPVLANRRLTAAEHFQDTRHIELGMDGSGLSYTAGDVLAVFPQQPPAAVEAFLARLGLAGADMVQVTARGAPAAAGFTCSLRCLVAGVLDVAGASPRRFLFQVLAQHCGAEMERQRLEYFATAEGRDDLYRYNQREGRTLLEVLQDFKSAQPPLEWLLTAAPLLKPRLFSISSGPALQPGRVHITAAVVTWTTPFKRTKLGLCSSWLAGLLPAGGAAAAAGESSSSHTEAESTAGATAAGAGAAGAGAAAGSRVPVWIERGSLRMPEDPQVPLLLVGPGTGVAPFRAFLQERLAAAQQAAAAGQQPPAPCHLFFGCRSRAADFYYEPEWQQLQEAGVLASEAGLVVAFSRDQASKVYVQHKIREHAGVVWGLLQAGAVVYVCGSADKMPADVAAAFRDVVVAQGGLGREEADKYVRRLQLTGRYHVEAWS